MRHFGKPIKTESTMVGEEKVEHPLEELFLLYPELNPDLGLLQIHGFITETNFHWPWHLIVLFLKVVTLPIGLEFNLRLSISNLDASSCG
ncbi:hypothetical protein Csa_020321 [Cucumis sativus]|uniref:Uncharacterized protein n=1 Tax=Cucumis sativus TaxID=3659 RepID=A0A0A0K0Y6_CUCSA|nr:hypothetical protein Csa_020321 [Cucumis sativus]